MSKQLKELHADCAEHHVEMAKCHDSMAKADGMEDSQGDFHSRCRDSHVKMAEAYLKCAKAEASDEVMKVRASVPFNVEPMFAHIVAVDEREQEQ